jgi:rubrerythrin
MTVTIPDFGALLAPHIGSVPERALPAFLARLERTAADRYRIWAEAVPEHAEGLLECAAREDDIADRVEALFPATEPEEIAAMDKAIVPAKDTYYAAFAELSPIEQITIQANAERQGAAAWRGMLENQTNADIRAGLERCAQIEEASADYLDALLADLI